MDASGCATKHLSVLKRHGDQPFRSVVVEKLLLAASRIRPEEALQRVCDQGAVAEVEIAFELVQRLHGAMLAPRPAASKNYPAAASPARYPVKIATPRPVLSAAGS